MTRTEQPAFVAAIWKGRFANLASRVTRLSREVQVIELAERMRRASFLTGRPSAFTYSSKGLGLGRECYRDSVYAARRREARKLGYSASDTGSDGIDVELADLPAAYVSAVDRH